MSEHCHPKRPHMRRILLFPAILALGFSVSAQMENCTANIENVAQHLGEIVLFCGTPSQVSAPANVEGDPVFLNFGGKYPDHTFSVVVWGDVAGNKRDKLVKRYEGKALRIKGWVKEYNGKLWMSVKLLDDIRVE